ncbi:unnamed protein product [Arctogadus glacialis]
MCVTRRGHLLTCFSEENKRGKHEENAVAGSAARRGADPRRPGGVEDEEVEEGGGGGGARRILDSLGRHLLKTTNPALLTVTERGRHQRQKLEKRSAVAAY